MIVIAPAGAAGAAAQSGERTPKDIQQALSSKGFDPGAIDGLWGKKSANALMDFQKANGLPATGKINDGTIAILFSEYPRFEDKLPSGIEDKQAVRDVGPEPSTKSASDQKTDRLPSKINAAQAKSATKITPKSVTTTTTVEVGIDDALSPPEQALGHPLAVYFIVSAVLAMLILFARSRKTKAAKTQSPLTVNSASIVDAPHASQAFTPTLRHRNDELATTEVRELAAHTISVSLAAHDDTVKEWVRQNAGRNRSRKYTTPDNDALTSIEERSFATETKQVTSLAAHAPAVKQWVTENAEASRRRHHEAQQQHFGSRTEPLVAAFSSTGWKETDTPTTIAGITISRGLIYVGKSLDKKGRAHEPENCLINPGLHVARWGDRDGRTMGYWPSYSSITPEARRSYLEWLAGDRSDPNAYIGYVFLYFYGLERRLMLERNAPDVDVVAEEVRRLVDVYGSNHSFNRYATELLTAAELRSGEPSAQFLAHIEPNGYEVPTAIRIALGVRVRDDRVMEPDLLYRFAMTHPETRARTPAKRAPELMRQLFAQQLSKEYPSGFRYKTARAKPLQKHYKACSGSFEVDIEILGGNIPDIAHHSEPIGMALRIFDACSDALDDYSRALGRLPGLTPNLMAVSKLPKPLRAQQAGFLEGRPLDKLARAACDETLMTVADIAQLVAVDIGTPPTKSKLREVSQLLAAFGFGGTFDPAFATKTASGSDPALVFQIAADTVAEPTERFRLLQLAMMLGLVIGYADGHFNDSERDTLIQRIEREPSLNADERSRLRAEMRVNEVNPDRLEEWIKRLKDINTDARMSLADELISMASVDGNLHAAEIRKLELIFKRMGLANQALYDRLHSGSRSAASSYEDMRGNVPDTKFSTRIDLSKLHRIRSETSVTASVLADIFVDDDTGAAETILVEMDAAAPESETFEGIEQRYGAFLDDLRLRASWSASDFDHLARDAGLMPGAAREAINDWAMDRFDELLIEGDDPVEISLHLLSSHGTGISADTMKGIPA